MEMDLYFGLKEVKFIGSGPSRDERVAKLHRWREVVKYRRHNIGGKKVCETLIGLQHPGSMRSYENLAPTCAWVSTFGALRKSIDSANNTPDRRSSNPVGPEGESAEQNNPLEERRTD
ncbi:pol protein [Anopheles sinensis]|uniref:Pol protein n=1 Tax=Anopheles sinensis TaxID=74873 RepID=A0A084WUB7_ANOSI|nr:pol protein [Anopheles sinensis]